MDAAPPLRFDGARLRERRETRGLSREELAVACHRSLASIWLYEAGRVVPPGRIVGALAGALDCSVADLYTSEVASAV